MAAVNLRNTARDNVVCYGVTLAADIRNVQLHEELLNQASLRTQDTGKTKTVEKNFKLDSEDEFRIYDVWKTVVGFDKNALKPPFQVTDACNNACRLRGNCQNAEFKVHIKLAGIKMRHKDVTLEKAELSTKAIADLKQVEKSMSNEKKGADLATKFMANFGSHFQFGNVEYGPVIEYAIMWHGKDGKTSKEVNKIVEEAKNIAEGLQGSENGTWYDATSLIQFKDSKKYEALKDIRIRVTQVCESNASDFKKKKEEMKKEKQATGLLGAELYPIWELVTRDSKNFTNAPTLAAFLKSTWSKEVVSMQPPQRIMMMELLGLLPYQETGISVEKVRGLTLAENSNKENQKISDIPWIVIQKLIRMDHRCRDNSTIKPIIDKNKKFATGKGTFHIMDVFLMVFSSCDMLLRQVLVQKMAQCRLAIPFVIPLEQQKFELSLWPLRSIAIEWMSSKDKSTEVSLVKHPFPIVSFIRIGDIGTSKSKILNDVLSDAAKDTFFHREASGGNKKRNISTGLIEMSYFLPPKGSSTITKEALFLNLRGDAKELTTQCSLLSAVSSVVVCTVEVKTMADDSMRQVLASVKKQCPNLVVILLGEDVDDEITEKLKADTTEVVPGYDTMDEAPVAASDLATAAKDAIGEALGKSAKPGVPLLDQKDVYRQHGIIVDEDSHALCSYSEREAKSVLKELDSKQMAEAKSQLLPLQGKDLEEWGKLLKKKHRGIKGVSAEETIQEKDKIATSMYECRQKQLAMASPLKTIMKQFIDSQLVTRPKLGDKGYFKFLKLELDDLSRSILPALRQQYQEAWQKKKENKQAYLTAEKKLDDSSFGAEHLFREMGQVYECMEALEDTLSQEQKTLMKQLPLAAAKYFLAGHSLEIMDGDAGVVPLNWVHAVFRNLHTMIGEKKMFVLAVVGVQSSGKSTLLNTMFGLELAVGAGRCTRGIYAQLLPVDKSSSLSVDYILVVDSEGLCGTISEDGKFEHDNEIATLVIGLADLTIVNIKGENTQQMKDIFEIAVHAFLRMKAVNKWKKQKCVFLHQSVSSAGAVPQLMRDRHALQDHLDEITREAAEIENMAGNIKQFSHVIDFDCERNVFYIPDLWNGVPPMAQVSIGYSDKIKEVRDVIVSEVEMSECSVTPIDMNQRLEDIWNGVLADDFLFSFKNNLSVKAYLMLETEFYKLTRQAESTLLEFINTKCKGAIENCANDNKLNQVYDEEKKKLLNKKTEVQNDCKKKLANFFETSEVKEHLAQWRAQREYALKHALDDIGRQMERDIQYYFECKHFEFAQVKMNKDEIIQKAKKLAETMKGKQNDDKKLLQAFNDMWNEWEKNLKIDQALHTYKVKDEMNKVITEIFRTKGHIKFLTDEMELKWKAGNGSMESEDLKIENMKKEYLANKAFPKDEKQEGKLWKGTDLVPKQKSRENYFPEVVESVNRYLKEIKAMLEQMVAKNVRFIPKLAHDVLKHIIDAVDRHNAQPYELSVVTLTPQFEAMIAVHVAKMATIRFEKLNAKFEDTLSMKAKMSAFKMQLQNQFLSVIKERVQEGTAGVLCDKIRQHIEENIETDIPRKAVDKILEKIKFKKHTLQVKVLSTLADKHKFNEYMEFIENVYGYSAKWVEEEAKKILFQPQHGTSEYGMFITDYLKDTVPAILKGIETAVTEANSGSCSMEQFVQKLKEHLENEVPLSDIDCQLLQGQNITDFNGFQKSTTDVITKMQDEILKKWSTVNANTVQWKGQSPYTQVMEKLWGCKERCPLCLSPCVYTYEGHLADDKDHRCLQHWPGGMSGIRWKHSQKLSTETCNFLISTNSQFSCGAARYQCRVDDKCTVEQGAADKYHPHREYKDYLKNWEIEEDAAGTATKYWQWVMYEFQKDLVKKYKTKAPDIPKEWKMKKEEAVKSLNKLSFEDFNESKERMEGGE